MTHEEIEEAFELSRRIIALDRLLLLLPSPTASISVTLQPSIEEDVEAISIAKEAIIAGLESDRRANVARLLKLGIYMNEPDMPPPRPA